MNTIGIVFAFLAMVGCFFAGAAAYSGPNRFFTRWQYITLFLGFPATFWLLYFLGKFDA